MKGKKILFLLLVIISIILILEFVFRYFVATTSERPTLVRENWLKKYWSPVNSMGYRDYDYDLMSLTNKRNIIIVGDSLTAGYGIKDYRDRYPNILQRNLGREWQLINISTPGWNLEQKVSAVCSYPYIKEAQLIIVQYYFDDAYPEMIKYCGPMSRTVTNWELPECLPLHSLLSKSYFFNYIYWRLYEVTFRFRTRDLKDIRHYFESVKASSKKISLDVCNHLNPLIQLCKANNIRLLILNIPHLEMHEEGAKEINGWWDDLSGELAKRRVPTIDIRSQYWPYKTASLRVNMSDGHPNEKAHRIIADYLSDELIRMNLIGVTQNK